MGVFSPLRRAANVVGLDIHRLHGEDARPQYSFEDYHAPAARPRWGYGRPSHPEIEKLLSASLDDYAALLQDFQRLKSDFAAIPDDARSAHEPFWNDPWFSTLDAAAQMALIALRRPKTYLEIGSGNSTKFARHIVAAHTLPTKIVSIDPQPRADIDGLCDRSIRKPLQSVDPAIFNTLSDGDILFLDGSHRAFMDSDVAAFFFDVLPRLQPGVLVHVHDIFWPDDYPPEWTDRLYSEQYLLGALLLGGRIKVLLPNYFVSQHPATAPLISALGIPVLYSGTTLPGVSFWLQTT